MSLFSPITVNSVYWLHFSSIKRAFNLTNKLSARSVPSKQALCCLLSENICILLRNPNSISARLLFFKASLLVQLAFRKAAQTSIVAQSYVFILAGGEHTPELRISTDPHGSRPLSSMNTIQEGMGGEWSNAGKNSSNWPRFSPRSEFTSAPTLHSEWPRAIRAWLKGLRAL